MKITILLYQGKGLISRLIEWQTRGPWSHAAIQIGDTVIESHAKTGVVSRPFSQKTDVKDVLRLRADVTSSQAEAMTMFLSAQLGKKYDYTMVMRFVSRRQESRRSSNKWFCSELVFAAFQHAGITLLARTEPWEVSPRMLARSIRLVEDNPDIMQVNFSGANI